MRNDNILNTGLNSAASRRIEEKRKAQLQDKQQLRNQLKPGAEVIMEWIAKEKKDVVNLEKMIVNIDSEEKVVAQLLARKMHLDFLESLGNRARNILKEANV